ncbi:hypothetical protein EQ718_06545 [Paracoccus versutus]|uniref:Recombinase zinc beta ribbon domain-containing protein n=1 Tax=Paracoccus versutus TaxID=34007 RepID=A0AAQ0HH20_PARVE|nr:hypothetical protein [Paracoccus versutus]REG46400.1 hypothetical protein ATH84_101517 [Paracoccus versutus]WEJ78559.1 hypothetical protein EQ718_06545 [Paracoccus versutus]
MISKDLLGCSTARNKGTCDNRMNIRRDELEARVLNALCTRLVDPDLFAEFCDAYTRETNRLRMESGAGIDKAETELKRIAREEEKLMDLYMRDALSIEVVRSAATSCAPARWSCRTSSPMPTSPRPCCIPRWRCNTGHGCNSSTRRCRATTRRNASRRRRSSARW